MKNTKSLSSLVFSLGILIIFFLAYLLGEKENTMNQVRTEHVADLSDSFTL